MAFNLPLETTSSASAPNRMKVLEDLIKSKLENKYYGQTQSANAMSKLAYANLMGPQFLAKLMGNPDVVANSPQLQDPSTAQKLYQAGMGGGSGNSMMQPPRDDQQDDSFSGIIKNKLLNIFSSPEERRAMSQRQGQQQGQGQDQGQQFGGEQPSQNALIPQNGPPQQDWQQRAAAGHNAFNQGPVPSNYGSPPSTSYSENAGNFAGVKEEGKEAGKIRANDIKDLNDIVFNADTKLATLNDLNDMIASPEMKSIRELPLAGSHELSYYAKEGTPAQQQLVGRLRSQMGNVIKDSARDFAGQFRKGEQQLLSGMKANDSDTIDTMIGKQESLTTMAQLLRDRASLTSRYMSQYHINKLQASEMADKQLNGEAIRQQVHDKLNPTILIMNRKTGEQKRIPVSEARKRGLQNVR